MKYNLNQPFLDLKGDPIKERVENGDVNVLFKNLISNSLLQAEEKVSGVESLTRFDLAQKIYKSEGEVELTAEDVVLIKKQVEKFCTPIVTAQVFKLLK